MKQMSEAKKWRQDVLALLSTLTVTHWILIAAFGVYIYSMLAGTRIYFVPNPSLFERSSQRSKYARARALLPQSHVCLIANQDYEFALSSKTECRNFTRSNWVFTSGQLRPARKQSMCLSAERFLLNSIPVLGNVVGNVIPLSIAPCQRGNKGQQWKWDNGQIRSVLTGHCIVRGLAPSGNVVTLGGCQRAEKIRSVGILGI
jgi:hypothetical protein